MFSFTKIWVIEKCPLLAFDKMGRTVGASFIVSPALGVYSINVAPFGRGPMWGPKGPNRASTAPLSYALALLLTYL